MIAALSAGLLLLWLLVIALAIVVVALLRQVGILHERLRPVGALSFSEGPKLGDSAPVFHLQALDQRLVTLGGEPDGRMTLLFFLSPLCPVCKSLLPVVKSIAREQGERLRIVLASDGDEPEQRRMIETEKLQHFPLVLSTELGLRFHVSKLPYAVLIDEHNRIASNGLVNSREHLESLFNAKTLGVGSLQEWRARGERLSAEG